MAKIKRRLTGHPYFNNALGVSLIILVFHDESFNTVANHTKQCEPNWEADCPEQ